MLQELFRIPFLNIPIYSYGLMMVIGFLTAIQLARYLAGRCGLDGEQFVNAGLLALVTGIAGARLSHVLENIDQFTRITPTRGVLDNLYDAVNMRSGGLTYYGGFLLAFPSLVLFAIKKKIPLRLGMDIVAPCIVIGLGFGRIGCFLNGCCYGDQCDLPWAVQFPYQSLAYQEEFYRGDITAPRELLSPLADGDYRLLSRQEIPRGSELSRLESKQHSLPLHPAQLYSAFTAFFIAGIVLCFFTIPHAPGRGFAMMLFLEGTTRYILELLRVEPAVFGPFSLSMIIGLALAVLGIILWFVFGTSSPLSAENRRIYSPVETSGG